MNNLTKIAALPTAGGCQSALRPEDRGLERVPLATGGPVTPGIAVPWADAPERFVPLPKGAPQPLVPIVVALGGFKELPALNPQPVHYVNTFTVGDLATRETVQEAVAARARRALPKGGAA